MAFALASFSFVCRHDQHLEELSAAYNDRNLLSIR
jgi:hypothetical protein